MCLKVLFCWSLEEVYCALGETVVSDHSYLSYTTELLRLRLELPLEHVTLVCACWPKTLPYYELDGAEPFLKGNSWQQPFLVKNRGVEEKPVSV